MNAFDRIDEDAVETAFGVEYDYDLLCLLGAHGFGSSGTAAARRAERGECDPPVVSRDESPSLGSPLDDGDGITHDVGVTVKAAVCPFRRYFGPPVRSRDAL